LDDGSLARLVNDEHKRPNAVMKLIELKGNPHLCLFARDNIACGTELRYSYGSGSYPWRLKVSKLVFCMMFIDANLILCSFIYVPDIFDFIINMYESIAI